MPFFGSPFTERFNYACKVQTFLDAENISYVPGFLIVLQLLGSLHIPYSWTWRGCLYHQYWGGANFVNGSALLSVHSPPIIGTYGMYLSCFRDPEESCNILHSCFVMALWTLLRKLSGRLLGKQCHSEAWLDIATEFEMSQLTGWDTAPYLSSIANQWDSCMFGCICCMPLGRKHRHKVMVHFLSK